jgi:alpha-L-fucosidase
MKINSDVLAAAVAAVLIWPGICLRAAPPAGSYSANWQSLTNHPTPQWYEDAKFGIYFHWSAYSVPAYGSEWYSHNMYQTNNEVYQHHLATYGSLDKFGYKDFIPKFTAEKFNADEWAELFQQAGARYAGPVAEHADGFSLWDSRVNPWNAARMGPKQDLVGKLERAIRKRNLKFITTFHHQWLWGWYSTTATNADVLDPAYSSFYGNPLPVTAFDYAHPQPWPDQQFCRQWHDKVIEVIDRYHPDLIYFDSRTMIIDEATRLNFLAYYYNQARAQGREVVMTYKNEDFATGAGVVDLECGRMATATPFKWQTDDLMDWNSWAYLERPNYKPAKRLIHQLIDIVSKNGNLLLDIGPRPDGTIPEPVKKRLLAMGAWLKLNGEAIYGTRPFVVFGEGPTKVAAGQFNEQNLKDFTSEDIRFTTKKGIIYATLLGWPEDGRVTIKSLADKSDSTVETIRRIELLGYKEKLDWRRSAEGLTLQLPAKKPCDYAWVLKITTASQ